MSVGVAAVLLGIGMLLAFRAKHTGLGAVLAVAFGFVLALTPLGAPVRDALVVLGDTVQDVVSGA